MLNDLPVPRLSSRVIDQIVGLVDQILEEKTKDVSSGASRFVNELNALVYRLYDLTPEEVLLIENAC